MKMALLKTALNNLKKGWVMNLLIVLEMTAAIVVFAVMISSILIRYAYYSPFKDVLNSKGICADLYIKNTTGNKINFVHDDGFKELLNGAEKIISTNITYIDGGSQSENNISGTYCRAYNDEAIKRFAPRLKSGRWLNTSDKTDVIEIVVSDNPYGWKLGDRFELYFSVLSNTSNLYPFTVEVVGELEKGANVFGYSADYNDESIFGLWFSPFDYEYEEEPLMLFSSEYLDKYDIAQSAGGTYIFSYDDSVSDENIRKDRTTLSKTGDMNSFAYFSFETVNENSLTYLYMQVYKLLPIIIVILILTFISSISSTALYTRERLRDYSIFYICGLWWNQCAWINLIQSAIISVIAIVSAFTGMFIIGQTSLRDTMTVIWSGPMVLGAMGIAVIYILVSMIMPAVIIRGSTPKEILTR